MVPLNINKIMFELIASQISERALKEDFSKEVTKETLFLLYKLSKKHDISQIVANALIKNNLLFDCEASEKFKKSLLLANYRYEKMKHDIGCIREAFESHGIPFILLKGAKIREFYSSPFLRTSCDIDVLIKPECCEAAAKVLVQKLGWKELGSSTLYDYRFETKNAVQIELHYALIDADVLLKAGESLKEVWGSVELCSGARLEYEMPAELFMLYHIYHMAKHFLCGGCGIKSFIDLYLLQRNFDYNEEELRRMLSSADLLEFYVASLKLCEVWFGGAESTQMSEAMEKFILDGGAYGTVLNTAVVSAGKGENGIEIFFKNAFLSRERLEVIYPKLKKRPYLAGAYQIKRWFGILKHEKREKILKSHRAQRNIGREAAQSATELLKNLNLIDK